MLGRAGSEESCCSMYHITVSTLTSLGTCRDHLCCLGVWCHRGSMQLVLVTRRKGVMEARSLRPARLQLVISGPIDMHAPAILLRRCDAVPARPLLNTGRPNSTPSIAHPCVLALPLVFLGVTKEPTAIIGGKPIGILPSDRAWLLDLPGRIAFKRTNGAGLFEINMRVDESRGKQGWSDTPFGRLGWTPL
ncbi:hypothetical protein BC827DRAFT_1157364 [Russula dissimulans]|nr:hypothetical protein BC827DRAFT_1157364 [Russula dissimulans]